MITILWRLDTLPPVTASRPLQKNLKESWSVRSTTYRGGWIHRNCWVLGHHSTAGSRQPQRFLSNAFLLKDLKTWFPLQNEPRMLFAWLSFSRPCSISVGKSTVTLLLPTQSRLSLQVPAKQHICSQWPP